MKNKAFSKKHLIPIFVVIISLLVFASFNDLQISQRLYDGDNIFDVIVAAFGHLPACFFSSLSGILILLSITKDRWYINFLKIMMVIAGFGFGFYYSVKETANVFPSKIVIVLEIAILVLFDILMYVKYKNYNKERIFKVGLFLLASVGFTCGILFVAKEVFVRPRYRLLLANEAVEFRNWWQTSHSLKQQFVALGVDAEEFRSFPSGHAGAGVTLCLITIFPYLRGIKTKVNERVLFNIGLIYALVIDLSRIVSGAHFLSDTLMSMLVGIVCIIINYILFIKYNLFNIIFKIDK